MKVALIAIALVFLFNLTTADASPSVDALLATVRKAGPGNAAQKEALAAYGALTKQNASEIPRLLKGLDGANPIAANWIRSAVDSIVERTLATEGKLPLAELETFLADRTHDPKGRRFAYELIVNTEPSAAQRWLPKMLDDPSMELRRDAVARVLDEAEATLSANADTVPDLFEKALKAARDEDQVKLASAKLKKLGREVNLPRHFGFLINWHLVGPFDNTGKKGFDVVYPPEEKIDYSADYAGKEDRVKWIDFTTADDYGAVDLNKTLGKHMGVVAYAAADFESDARRPVDFRLGTMSGNKLWLNGKLLHSAAVYHAGMMVDQYIAKGELKPGRNQILLKLCQNEQTEDWAQDWKFQLRVCDELGTAVLSSDRATASIKETLR